MPWAAEITGRDPVHRYRRAFLTPKQDHPGARDGISNEVHYWWTLTSGRIYQTKYLTGPRSGWTTRWLVVTDDGDIIDMTEQEVDQWLNACSASTS
jgi:hypothetical protein